MIPDYASLVQVNLAFGRDKARTIGAVAEEMQLPRRVVEKAIEELRRAGVPVCSAAEGVWLSLEPAEIRACADSLNARVRRQYATVRAMRATAARYGRAQQLTLTL